MVGDFHLKISMPLEPMIPVEAIMREVISNMNTLYILLLHLFSSNMVEMITIRLPKIL